MQDMNIQQPQHHQVLINTGIMMGIHPAHSPFGGMPFLYISKSHALKHPACASDTG